MLQETAQADAVAGRSILLAILLSSVTGMAYLLGLTYCISVSCITSGYVYIVAPSLSCQLHTVQDYDHVLSLDNETGGLLPVGQVSAKLLHELCRPNAQLPTRCLLQILWDSFAKKYGTGTRCIPLLGIPLGACWFCGLLSMTAASRMMYSFSRDGAIPFHRLIRFVDPGTQAPIVAGAGPCQHSYGRHWHAVQHLQSQGVATKRSASALHPAACSAVQLA